MIKNNFLILYIEYSFVIRLYSNYHQNKTTIYISISTKLIHIEIEIPSKYNIINKICFHMKLGNIQLTESRVMYTIQTH